MLPSVSSSLSQSLATQSAAGVLIPTGIWTHDELRRVPRPSGEYFLKPERVQEELRAMPGWRGVAGYRGIDHIRRFPTAEVAAAFAAYVSAFAQETGQLCSVVQCGEHVTLMLTGRHPGGSFGVTRGVLDFAKRLA
jgi:pterin-4a-carbinolamine dehydratase